MKKRRLLAVAAAAAPWLWTACAPGVQPLLDDYNSMFDVTLAGQDGGGGNDRDWLQDTYDVSVYHTLNLHAPVGCSSYSWKLEPYPGIEPKVELPQDFNIEKYVDTDSRSWLKLYLADAKIKSGAYKLTSTIVRNGETLTDTSKLMVLDEKGG